MARRTGDEPDPPQIDFSSTGQGIIDMTNIDFKFPSEHTVCGQVYDGEMQYFVYNSQRKRFLAVSFLLDGEHGLLFQLTCIDFMVLNLILSHCCSLRDKPKK